ncbi:DNA (cytosine-5)-methyltransferase 3B isoform X2 [Oryzias latipes]|uniref:DNA (cytosine-5-)-methyltransferase n=1 Tax=Oryzias latipes TaxID=8090 RepID=A0A3B3H773_ORYLA|nr:DNA (cytosine-5)-methyltransferase 3B isoform X2 [Oryzias latipes]
MDEKPEGEPTEAHSVVAEDCLGNKENVIELSSEDEDCLLYVSGQQKAKQANGKYERSLKEEPAEEYQATQKSGGCSCNVANVLSLAVFQNEGAMRLKEILQAVSSAPFCLYLYVGVKLEKEEDTSFVLIGYFDQSLGKSVVRPLKTLQLSVDATDPQTSTPIHGVRPEDSDARLLIKALKDLNLPLSNLSMFYCSTPHPSVSHVFVSQLQAFNSKLISLCGIPGMAERACLAGLTASFGCVVDLVKEIHHYYSTCLSVNDTLKEVFAGVESVDPFHPGSERSSFIIRTVQKMVSCWQDLVEYFKSLANTEDTKGIKTLLMDDETHLRFLFLAETLEPLRGLHELQMSGNADLAVEFQLTALIVKSYAASILQPSAAERFLRRRDACLLDDETQLLPLAQVRVGSHVIELMEGGSKSFIMKNAQTFYKAALWSLVKSLPEQLGDTSLRNIEHLLKDPQNTTDPHSYCQMLSELGVHVDQCPTTSAEEDQLTSEYVSFMQTLKKSHCVNGGDYSWTKMLHSLKPSSALHRFLLTLLALPASLDSSKVLAKVSKSTKCPHVSHLSPKATPDPGRSGRRAATVQRNRCGRNRVKLNDGSSSDDDGNSTSRSVRWQAGRQYDSIDMDEYTDHSSDVIDVTEESFISEPCRTSRNKWEVNKRGELVLVVTSDEEDLSSEASQGDLVWGLIEGFSPWPGVVIPTRGEQQLPGKRMVEWYGQKMTSQITLQNLKPFAAFSQHFCPNSYATLITYREAIFSSLQEAALRCKKQFSVPLKEREKLLKQMLDWAEEGFQPTGPDGFKPATVDDGFINDSTRPKAKKKLFHQASPPSNIPSQRKKNPFQARISEVTLSLNQLSCQLTPDSSHAKDVSHEELDVVVKRSAAVLKQKRNQRGWTKVVARRGEGAWEEEKVELPKGWEARKSGWGKKRAIEKAYKKTSSLLEGFDDDMSPDFMPQRKRNYAKAYNKVSQAASVYHQPNQKLREDIINKIMKMELNIEGFCLCCGTEDVKISHPLFKGSLCLKCKDNFTETLYRYDQDGYQSYCTICCYGMEVILCGNDSCCRSYCNDCLNILAGPGTFESLKVLDPWICYLCQPHKPHGALVPREDWSIRVQELFANTSAIEFEPHRVYPSIPASLRRPVRVLSLFDGIGTGYLVLKDLGFKVEKYVASEVCEDSITVSAVNHDGKILQIGDVRFITKEFMEAWGPFDLLIGGSPCNDLSIVNPVRKGLYEGTGRLFFEFYRILQLLKPKEDDPRPFFWLYENVVFMNTHDKVNICRFLECNPVLVDAVKVSPAHRARYFWGNIPGMSRPIIASQNHRLTLQDCLDIGRQARVTKVRTITTNPNSLKQGKNVSLLPVLHNGREDNLWITELEKIFGFPKHYTDVRNMNRQQRQKVLGKAWSVPVIHHLFAPLKDYFTCKELPSVNAPSPPASPPLPPPGGPAAAGLESLFASRSCQNI